MIGADRSALSRRARLWLLPLVCFTLLFYAFFPVLPDLYAAWQTDEYSHGILIPFIAALLGWHLLVDKQPTLRASAAGAALILLAGLLLVVGRLAAFAAIAQYGFILALAGLALAVLGRRALAVLAPAFLYLVFAVPLPHIAYASLSQHLQLASSSLGVAVLDALRIPVYQEGNVIDLAGIRLQVVEACSGLRYLFPLMSFGYLVAYLLDDRLWKRLVIFLSSMPIAIGMNALRIAFIGITVELWGNGMAGGLLHDFEGWVIFLFSVLVLLLETALLRRVGRRGTLRLYYLGPARGPLPVAAPPTSGSMVAALLAALVLAALTGSRIIDNRPQITVAHPAFADFPLSLPPWHGHRLALDADVLQALALSDYLLADYQRADAPAAVNFYMAYYDTQRTGAAPHSPANCIPGGGWQIASNDVITVPLAEGRSVTLSRLLIRKAETAQLVYYWFDERGRDVTGTVASKWYMLQDAITMRRTDGALIRLVTPIGPQESEAAAGDRLDGFLRQAYPEILTFVPGATP